MSDRKKIERRIERFMQTGEVGVLRKYETTPPTDNEGWSASYMRPSLAKKEGRMRKVDPLTGLPVKGKGKKSKRAAKKAARSAGIPWSELPGDVRKGLVRDAKNARILRKLAKLGGSESPVAAPTVDAVMAKGVFGSAVDLEAAKGALQAIRAALGRPSVGAGGWR